MGRREQELVKEINERSNEYVDVHKGLLELGEKVDRMQSTFSLVCRLMDEMKTMISNEIRAAIDQAGIEYETSSAPEAPHPEAAQTSDQSSEPAASAASTEPLVSSTSQQGLRGGHP